MGIAEEAFLTKCAKIWQIFVKLLGAQHAHSLVTGPGERTYSSAVVTIHGPPILRTLLADMVPRIFA